MQLSRNLILNIFLTLLAALYYLLFINKGLILFDEGYIVHFAERIVQGQVPYYDFFIQYTPGFFYILAFFFKIFGTSILVGRIVALLIALGIIMLTLLLLDEIKLNSFRFKAIAVVTLSSFGFPLFNIPVVVWPGVLLSIAIMLVFVKWSKSFFASWKYPVFLGILLALMLFIKHNLGFAYLVTLNFLFILLPLKDKFLKVKNIVLMNCVFLLISAPWIYYFFIRSDALFTFLSFNQKFFTIYPPSYPPLSYLLQPLGLFKLLPYYLPIIFLLLLFFSYIFHKWKKAYIFVSVLPLVGFAATVVPASDLLHVYPFLGLTLVMFLVFIKLTKWLFKNVFLVLIIFVVFSGFYLTLFEEQYRYGVPFRLSTTPLNFPKTRGVLVDADAAKQYSLLNTYVANHTKKGDYIFVYPFSPMLYFIFDRPNPSRYANYLPGYLTKEEESLIIKDLEKKKVSLIIAAGEYRFPTPLSQWIQKQKKTQQYGQFIIFASKK